MERNSPSPIFFFYYFLGQKPLPFLKNKENIIKFKKLIEFFRIILFEDLKEDLEFSFCQLFFDKKRVRKLF